MKIFFAKDKLQWKLLLIVFLSVLIVGTIIYYVLTKNELENLHIIPEGHVTYRGAYVDDVWFDATNTVSSINGWEEDLSNGTYTSITGEYLELKLPKGERKLVFNADPIQGSIKVKCNTDSVYFVLTSEETISYGKAYDIPNKLGVLSYISKLIFFVFILLLFDILLCAILWTSLNDTPTFSDYNRNILSILTLFITGIHLQLAVSVRTIISPIKFETIIPSYFYGCFLFAIIMIVFTIILIAVNHSNNRNREKHLYWLCVGIVMCSIFIRKPLFSWQAEPYWETGTNMIWQTYELPWFDALLLDDAGYWSLLPRIAAIFIIKICREMRLAPIILQLVCVIFFSFVVCKIVKPELSQYGSIENRILICFLFGTTAVLSDTIYLHNIAYIGGILILLNFLSDMNTLPKWLYIVDCIICFVSCCSKPQILAFLPAFLPYLFFARQSKEKRKKRFLLFNCLGCFLSAGYYLAGIGKAEHPAQYEGSILTVALNSVYEMFQGILSVFIPYQANGYCAGGILNFCIGLFLLAISIKMIRQKNDRIIRCIVLGAFGVGTIMIYRIGYNSTYNFEDILHNFTIAKGIPLGRNYYLAFVVSVLILLVVLSNKQILKQRNIIMIFWMILLLRFSFQWQIVSANTSCMLNWKEYSVCLEKDVYGIPAYAKPGGFLLKNAKVYYYGNQEIFPYDGHYLSGVSKSNTTNGLIQNISFEKNEVLVSVYTNKRYLGGMDKIVMNIYDCNNDLIKSVDAIDDYDRFAVGFILEEPCQNVSSIEFINANTNQPYYFASHLFTVVEDPGVGISDYASWGRYSIEET